MSNLNRKLSVKPGTQSPWIAVLLVVLLQVLLLVSYFYLAQQDQLKIESAELVLLLTYSAIAIVLAFAVSLLRFRWMKQEDTVRQRLLGVIDAIADPAAVRDLKGRYVMWNQAAETYHGIKAEHVFGKTPFDLFPKEVARSMLALDAQCSIGEKTVIQRLELPPLYGKEHRVSIMRVAPVRSNSDRAGSKIRGTVTILQDVTVSEKEAAELRQTTAQLKMALDTSGFGGWVWDLASDAQTYSAQYQALLHYQGKNFSEDFVFFDRLHPGDLAVVKQEAKRSIQEKKPYNQVYRLRCFDEKYRYFHVSGEPVTDDKGQLQFAGLLCPLDRNAD